MSKNIIICLIMLLVVLVFSGGCLITGDNIKIDIPSDVPGGEEEATASEEVVIIKESLLEGLLEFSPEVSYLECIQGCKFDCEKFGGGTEACEVECLGRCGDLEEEG